MSEDRHRYHLDIFLNLVKEIDFTPTIDRLVEMEDIIQDNLNIARSVGYIQLADDYALRFRKEDINVK